MVRCLCATLLVLAACGENLQGPPDAEPPGNGGAVMLVAPNTLRIVEGEPSSFALKLVNDPQRDVSVTVMSRDTGIATVAPSTVILSSENYALGAAVELINPEDDEDLINETTDVLLLIDGHLVHTVAIEAMDNDVQQIITDKMSVSVVESLVTATFTVRLARQPSGPMTLNVRSSATDVATASPATVLFAAASYAVPQVVTISGVLDNDTVDDNAVISIGDLPGVVSPTVDVFVDDDDLQQLMVSAQNLSFSESEGATFFVWLAYDPVTPVTLSVTTSDPAAVHVVSASTLTFDSTTYASAQMVQLASDEDDDMQNENVTVTMTGPPSNSVSVALIDNDQLIVPNQIFVDEGGTAPLLVKLANDPGSGGSVVNVQVISGDASIANGTLNFSSSTYAAGMAVTITGLADPYSTEHKSALIRVSSAGQTSRDVQVTVVHRIPGQLMGHLIEQWDSSAGAIGALELSLNLTHAWPGDGVLELNFPSVYDLSGVTIAGASVDGSFSIATVGSKLIVTRANGSASAGFVAIRFSNWRNPPISGSYWIPVETRTAAAVPIDKGNVLDVIGTAPITDGSVSLSNQQPSVITTVTFTFTTKNPWPEDGRVVFYPPPDLDMSSASVMASSGFDGALTFASGYGYPTAVRSGGTAVPAGTKISITLGNVTNPPTGRETSAFSLETASASHAGIDRANISGVIIGCPPIRRSPMRAASVPFGTRPWQWDPSMRIQWGYPATVTMVGETELLVLDDFRFALPQGATIAGIELEVRHDVQTDQIVDSAVRLVKGGVVGATDRSSTAPWAWWTSALYGGATDLWSQTWSPGDILDSTFGVAIAARSASVGVTATAGVGSVMVTVYSSCP